MPGLMDDQRLLARAHALLNQEGDARGAVNIYLKLLKRRPNEPALMEWAGTGLIRMGKLPEARKHLVKAVKLRPTPHAYRNLARTYEYEGKAEEAIRTLDRGLREHPRETILLAGKADALYLKGDVEEAWKCLAPGIDAKDPQALFVMAKLSPKVGKTEVAIEALREALDNGAIAEHTKPQAHFQLAELYDRAGEHEKAFDAAEVANRLRGLKFDPDAYLRDIDRLIAAWTPEAVPGLPRAGDATELPIFIVGMPRSGTSLVEQIIASHPRAHGAGECVTVWELSSELPSHSEAKNRLVDELSALTPGVVNRLGRKLIMAMRKHNRNAARVSDKLPANTMHVGLISLLAPGGHVVHCLRHPLDSCTSCFFRPFPHSINYAGDLEHLAAYYAGYRKLMLHWKEVLDYPILDEPYEELVEDFDRRARELIDFVGLEWDEACARFHETKRITATASVDQVRTPLYSSAVARWKRYGAKLDPLKRALESYGVPVEW